MKKISIAECIAEFKKTKNPLALLKAAMLIIRQGRIDEVLFGIYCRLFFKPSTALAGTDELEACMDMAKTADAWYQERQFFTSAELIECFGDKFNVSGLPLEFTKCRTESIIQTDNLLIVGDYANTDASATVAIMSKDTCTINNFYNQLPGVVHIHSIHLFNESELLISTGDTKKLTDLWTIENNGIKFKKRLRSYLAGYTGAIKVNNQHFFGTDFSGRPNYIETLEGERYFFPAKAYKMHVCAFYAFADRYIASINTDLVWLGGRKTLSIFDTANKQFIFCEYLDLIPTLKSLSTIQPDVITLDEIPNAINNGLT
jgi:hypothetical protein